MPLHAADLVAQKFQGGHTPHTLAQVDGETVFGEAFEDDTDVTNMFLR